MSDKHHTVAISSGLIQGTVHRGVAEFRGIPFAGPIGGTRRFRRAQPAPRWKGVHLADTWAPMVPQSSETKPPGDPGYLAFYRSLFGDNYTDNQTENGLYLNVWSAATERQRKPVMVYLHGGAFANGSATRPRENGAALSRRENIVVVAPSHRLGIMGYLDVRELDPSADANVGMTDIILALRWIQENIEAFGGDRGNVTLFGESGGSLKIQTLLVMPEAKGLFHKAICQSGAWPLGALNDFRSPSESQRKTREILGSLVIKDPQALAEVPITDIVSASGDDIMSFGPVLDPATLPTSVLPAISAGWASEIPLLIGTNAHEYRFLGRPLGLPQDVDSLVDLLDSYGGPKLVEHYLETRLGLNFRLLAEDVLTDAIFRIPSIRFASRKAAAGTAPVFMYLFDWQNERRPDIGASHGIETPFVLLNTDAVEVTRTALNAAATAKFVSAAWAAFARQGEPNISRLPTWRPYDSKHRSTMILGKQARLVDDPASSDRLAWDKWAPTLDPGGPLKPWRLPHSRFV